MGRILEEGINAMRQGEARRQFIASAAARFEALGTPEAVQMAQMIRQNPEGATQYMQQFGGWNSVYDLTRADAARTALTSALGQLGGASTQQEVMQRLLPVALQFGLDGSLVKMVGEAYEPQGVPGWANQILSNPHLYENVPEFVDRARRTGDWEAAQSVLRTKSGGDDIIGGKYLAVRDEQGRLVGAKPIPGVRFGEGEGSGSQKPPSGYRWRADGSLEPIPGGPAEIGGRVADILARDARGEPISEGDAALVNNYNKQFPDPLGLQRPVFKPRNMSFEDLVPASGARPAQQSMSVDATAAQSTPVPRSGEGYAQSPATAATPAASVAPAGAISHAEVVERAKQELAKGTDRAYIEAWMASQGVHPSRLGKVSLAQPREGRSYQRFGT